MKHNFPSILRKGIVLKSQLSKDILLRGNKISFGILGSLADMLGCML
ncbi:hypothetical protein JCM19297_2849 [Nonlabens ulvanivorans]|nr:hypothetical protein JCM19297_2849 [Nonlabens ulvanivorans]